MRVSLRLAVALALAAFSARPAASQTPFGIIAHGSELTLYCGQTGPDTPISDSRDDVSEEFPDVCEDYDFGVGTGSAFGARHQPGGMLLAFASLTQTGSPLDAISRAQSIMVRGLTINGQLRESDRFVFHFSMIENTSALENVVGSQYTYSEYGFSLEGAQYEHSHGFCECEGEYEEDYLGDGVTQDGSNVDIELGFYEMYNLSLETVENITDYYFEAFAEASLFEEGVGALSRAGIGVQLLGIDVYDGSDFRGAALFDQDGEGFIELLESPTPEPATLALLGTGLLGCGIVARPRRKTH